MHSMGFLWQTKGRHAADLTISVTPPLWNLTDSRDSSTFQDFEALDQIEAQALASRRGLDSDMAALLEDAAACPSGFSPEGVRPCMQTTSSRT